MSAETPHSLRDAILAYLKDEGRDDWRDAVAVVEGENTWTLTPRQIARRNLDKALRAERQEPTSVGPSNDVRGRAAVRAHPLIIRRRWDPHRQCESTFLFSWGWGDQATARGFFAWLPDSADGDPRRAREIRRCDLENAMHLLEYVAGGGTI